MNVQSHLEVIRRAKSSHLRWRAYAQALAAGVPVQEDQAPLAHTQCAFGKWYYGEGQSALGHLSVFQDIETPHELLHAIYAQVHEAAASGKLDKAHERLSDLVEMSKTLLQAIELLEAEVRDMG